MSARTSVACSEKIGNQRIDTNAESDGKRVDKILNREDEGQRCHGIFIDSGDEQTVYNIIKCVYHHGYDHRKRHGGKQRQYRFFFHKCFVHVVFPPTIMSYIMVWVYCIQNKTENATQ